MVNVLRHGDNNNGLIFAKLKRKLSLRHHGYLKTVTPEAVQSTLVYLKQHNPFYHYTINIYTGNI